MYGAPKFKRVIQYIWDPEPQNTDHDHEIVCLGKTYSPVPGSPYVSTPSESTPLPNDDNSTNTSDQPPLNDVTDAKRDASNTSSLSSSPLKLSGSTTPVSDQSPQNSTEWPRDFLEDVDSKIWFTYRTNFPSIPKSRDGPSSVSLGRFFRGSGIDLNGFTSDVGWGCMIRTSQSLLANCIFMLQLGRDWRWPTAGLNDKELQIISMFTDQPDSLFSVHNFVKHGEVACGKKPGEWFGPSAAASSIKALHQQNINTRQNTESECNSEINEKSSAVSQYGECFRVFISSGSDVYERPFFQVAIDSKTHKFYPTLILLGVRLGIDKVNKVYWPSLKAFLASSQAVGIAGGRPSSSHYFYGYQGDSLFYLDPHFPKPALDPNALTSEAIETVHTRRIRCIHLDEMDPSMLMGVLIKDQDDWDNWKHAVENGPMKSIIHISPAPVELRRSSVSVSNDDDFIDVMLEPEDDFDEVVEGDSDVMVDSDHLDASDDFAEPAHEPAVIIEDRFHTRDPTAASMLDISTTSGGQIRTRSISGTAVSSLLNTPETPENCLNVGDEAQLDASTISLLTESGNMSEANSKGATTSTPVPPITSSKNDTATTPTSSSLILAASTADDKGVEDSTIDFSINEDPVLVTQSTIIGAVPTSLSSGEEIEKDASEEASLNSEAISSTDGLVDVDSLANKLPETPPASQVGKRDLHIHRDSDSSYQDVGNDQSPISIIKSSLRAARQEDEVSIESTDDEFATNVSQAANGKDDDDDEAFQRLSLSVDNMTIKPQCESEEDADDEDYSRIESQSRSGSVGLSSNSSFHDDGFQKVFVPGSYNSMSSSTWGIVNNKDSPESLHGQATAAKKSEEFENVEEKDEKEAHHVSDKEKSSDEWEYE